MFLHFLSGLQFFCGVRPFRTKSSCAWGLTRFITLTSKSPTLQHNFWKQGRRGNPFKTYLWTQYSILKSCGVGGTRGKAHVGNFFMGCPIKKFRDFEITISPDPLDLFRRLKQWIEVNSILYRMIWGFQAMRAKEMIEIAFQQNFPENKVAKAIETYHYCFQVNISGNKKLD